VSLLEIHVLGSPVLREETKPVGAITDELRQLVEDMFETMRAAQGIGLAAPQVGRLERVAVVDVDNDPIVLINPEIVAESGSERAEEGCLSIPDIYGDVDRAARVTVRATNLEGKTLLAHSNTRSTTCTASCSSIISASSSGAASWRGGKT
jgi:peptide deformylase